MNQRGLYLCTTSCAYYGNLVLGMAPVGLYFASEERKYSYIPHQVAYQEDATKLLPKNLAA